jgi:hypothetical protein
LRVIINTAYYAIVSDPISPKTCLVAGEDLSGSARGNLASNALLEKTDDTFLRDAVEFFEFT